MKHNSIEWNSENFSGVTRLYISSLQASDTFQSIELQRLTALQVWRFLNNHLRYSGSFDLLDHSLSVKAISYVSSHTATDAPKHLARLTMDWLRRLVEEHGFRSDIHSWKSWDRVWKEVDTLQESNPFFSPGCSLARILLENGFKSSELDSEAAINYLLKHGYDETYVSEFLHPAPPVFWRGSVDLSWLEDAFAEALKNNNNEYEW